MLPVPMSRMTALARSLLCRGRGQLEANCSLDFYAKFEFQKASEPLCRITSRISSDSHDVHSFVSSQTTRLCAQASSLLYPDEE